MHRISSSFCIHFIKKIRLFIDYITNERRMDDEWGSGESFTYSKMVIYHNYSWTEFENYG